MARQILILDTSILCCLLAIPGKDTCGAEPNVYTRDIVEKELEKRSTATRVLPLASIIETGNHIAQASHSRFEKATQLMKIFREAVQGDTPWAAFGEQAELWSKERIFQLAKDWPELAKAEMSLGDATIKDVAEYYAQMGWDVEILTGDEGLKAYQPMSQPPMPRRRGG